LLFCLPRILDSGSPGFAQADIDHIADFNGDGLPDFYLVYSGAGTLLTGGIAGIAITQAGAVSAKINSCSAIGLLDDGSDRDDCSPHKNYFHRWMDVNADGLEDFVIARPPVIRTEGTWRVRLNLGNGMFGPQIDTGSSAGLQVDATGIPAGPGLKFRYVGSLPSMDVDSDGRADLLIPSQQPGAQAFALKMCTIKRIHKIQTADGPKCPSASEQLVDPSGIYLAEGPVCAAYSCPPNPDGSAPMPANGEPLGDARGFPYQWPDENGNPLPAFSAYSSHPNHEGPGEDNSVYHLAQLKFVQTGPQQFTVDVIPTPMVSRLNDYYGSADDLFGDGLPDLLTSMGCSNLVLTQPPLPNSPPYTWQHQKCAVVNALGYGPATLPDGTPTANLASKVVLYANINQGLAAPGGSPGSIAVPHVQAPTLKASGSSLGLSLSVPHLPGLMDSVINGVGDFVSWGYFPLSVRAERDGVDLYRLPSDTASGYTDKRHYYFQSSMPVVYGMAQDRGDGGIDGFRSATYGYSEAMYHHLGRGFQGFREIVSTRLTPPDSESRKLRLRTTTTFHQKFPLTGRIEQVETQAPVPTAPNVFRRIKREFDTWICASDRSACPEGDDLPPPAVNPNGGTVYAPLLDRQVVETFDLDSVSGAAVSTVATVNAEAESGGASGWDGYGNLKHQYVLSTDSVVAEHRVITTNEYAPSDTSTNNWWLDRLRNSEVTTSQTYGAGHPLPLNVAQPPSRTVRTDFLWNDDRTPQSQTVTASGMTLTTAYDYTQTTAKGLPAKVTISGTGLTSARATQFTYTKDGNSLASQQDGYFVLTTKNAALHDSTTQHSPRDGQVTRQIDPNNLEVVNAYDAFGRLTGMSFKDANGDPMLPPVSIGYTPCTTRGCGNGYGEGGSHQAGAAWRVVRTQAGAPTTADWFDRLGRAIKHTERGFSETDFVESFTDYDPMGLVATQSGPFYRTEGNAGLTVWDYDVLGRPTEKRSPGEELDAAHGDVVTKYAYSGAKTTIQVRAAFNASQQTCTSSTNLCMDMSRSHDLLGRLAQTVQNNGDAANYATTDYWYDGLGNPIAARDAGGSVIKASYNSLGQRTDLFDLDAGHWSFTYDALGEVLDQTDGRNVTTTHAYDALGRLTQRDASNPSAADASLRAIRDKWEYDPPGGAGLLESSQRQTGTSASTLGTPIWKQSNLYDPASKRLSTQTTAIQGLPIWQTDYRYDGNGRLKTTTFPSSLEVENTYTAYGVLSGLRDSKSGAKYWEAISQDAWGNVTEEKFFGGSVTGAHSSYPSTGQSAHKVWSDAGGTLNRLDYQYDSFGNLNTQSSLLDGASHSESYLYDGLQRLKQATRSGVAGNPAPVSYAYKPNGNLANKTDYSTTAADAYSYGAGNCGPHAASAVARPNQPAHTFTCDANGNIVGGNTLRADYDFNNQPWKVDRIDSGTSASFAYSAEGQVFRSQSGGKTTWFGAGGYEETQSGTGTTQRHELGPVIVLRENGTDTFKAVLRDRLGSPVMLVAGSPAAGNSPRLSASPNPSLDGRYTISWTAMPGATRYELVESTNGSPESLVLNYLQQTWSPLTPKPVGRYTYRVRACTPACGDWSDPLVEYRAPNPPSTVSASAPTQSGSFTVSWSAAAGAESYTLEEKAPGAAT
ncbi:MAG: hypothetical protein KDK91_29420, partial [Gammaproteobacteria bacterium]|nr:hypothetical protein [Gammaproteobacteria bacterium]